LANGNTRQNTQQRLQRIFHVFVCGESHENYRSDKYQGLYSVQYLIDGLVCVFVCVVFTVQR